MRCVYSNMVKIDTVNAYGATSQLRKKDKPRAKSAFTVAGDSAGSAPRAVETPQSAAEMASLSQLMQIQEVGERDSNSQQALAGGESILASLEKLQNEILGGAISKSSLEKIASMTNTLPAQITDPNLKQVVEAIKQRALVEIAKIEMG